MSLLVVGSIAFDAVETPFGKRERMLGGSATHFSLAASFFANVRIVGVVGGDFGADNVALLQRHGVDTTDLECLPEGKTFFWRGRYDYDLNTAHTLETQLNVFADFKPKLSEESKRARFVFLGNIQPDLQYEVREQVKDAQFVALDTMNLWIETARPSLIRAIERVDAVIINDAEARQLADEPNLIRAARKILSWGPAAVVVKRGEYGAALFTSDAYFAIPAYPLESVFDPTGAGDTFAGGFMGYLASCGEVDEAAMRRAMIFGSVMASFNVEEFGTERVQRLTYAEINERFREFKRMTSFEEIPFERVVKALGPSAIKV
ncbi:PfkB family carbohydrate kinase [Pyrinomonas methylaliphatogenes]|uniref:Sugar kinase, ribokinase n=1 Tax=Pyrinomonas methylaliphatogenes TaxID=454194 RepID=A0A0B6WT74_9BACT|nr:PfkB family carbohydrate kinase [Pyrinomonas methylaliphatogenes]CDM64206.1 sugar kinase, ribokinase [Pyrinomonas methylaliphatogenes]